MLHFLNLCFKYVLWYHLFIDRLLIRFNFVKEYNPAAKAELFTYGNLSAKAFILHIRLQATKRKKKIIASRLFKSKKKNE